MMTSFREWIFRIWYWYVNNIDKNAEVLFMNYGYSDPEKPLTLDPQDEPNRYSIQLYNLLASSADLKNKNILEIGCGRGGGLAFVAKKYQPATAVGVDLDKNAAAFCNKNYKISGMSFQQGNAMNLPNLPSNSFDAILNVESSHRYPQMDKFLAEVMRLLKPGGYFLYTDFRYDWEMKDLKAMMANTGMVIHKEQLITANVVKALEADDPRKRILVKKLAPRLIHKVALNFAGTIGSETYNQFATRKYEYYFYVMQKK